MADLRLVAVASSFALTSAFGAAVSAHHDIPGEPLALRVPGPVRVQLLTGLGSGLSAPLPMPLAAMVAAVALLLAGRRSLPLSAGRAEPS